MGITQLKQRQITALGFLQQGLAQGMATARFKAGSQLHQPIGIKISQGLHRRHQGTPQGEGACFIILMDFRFGKLGCLGVKIGFFGRG